MQRLQTTPRDNWQKTVERDGLTFHTPDGNTYWDESAYYSFTSAYVDELEAATNELHEMCLSAVQYVIDKNRFSDLHIPLFAAELVRRTWEEEPPAIYGRFDLACDGSNIKLLEYNADTPTALLEAAVSQWWWLQDKFPSSDQFNSIHEKLIAKWKELRDYAAPTIHFAHTADREDTMTAIYMEDTAQQAGLSTRRLFVSDIGWNSGGKCFTDLSEAPIATLFKLYPWEWLIHEEFGKQLSEAPRSMQWMEPIWKMVLSNKGILPILWEMYPNHKHLLKAYADSSREMTTYVKKPLLSREGANVTLVGRSGTIHSGGEYGEEGFVYQDLASYSFAGKYPVVGSWVIDGVSAGIGIRESDGPITDNLSRFVPHRFDH